MHEIEFHTQLWRPGLVVDVGAHDGALAVPLSRLPGARLLAFEPLPPAFARLQAAMRAAYDGEIPPHVTLRTEALGAAEGRIVLEVPVVAGQAQEQWASIVKDYSAMQVHDTGIEAVQRYSVALLRLDALALEDVTAIKLDAEGSELEVILGAEATIRRCQPLLSVEIEERHRQGSTTAVPALLATFGYRGFYESRGAWWPAEGFDPTAMQSASPSPAVFDVPDSYVFCFYFVPMNRVSELPALARLP